MLNKLKKICAKYQKLIVLLFIIIAVATFSFNVKLDANDDLWNFSNIYKMSNGYTIYKDLNVIITPLFFYIVEIIFKIFGCNYFVFRICNVIIFTFFYMLLYWIFETLEIKGKRGILYLILTYAFTYSAISGGANYNVLAIDLVLLGILLILKQKTNWFQGIIIFLIFMTKQNIGIYYAIGYILYELIKNKNIKETIKTILPSGIIAIALVGVYLLYLYLNQNLYNFINYAFLGISEFGTNNFCFDENIGILITVMLSHLTLIWMLLSKQIFINEKVKQQTATLMSFSVPSLLIAYPLINKYHVILAVALSIITFIYIIEKGFLEELTVDNKTISRIINIIIIIFCITIIALCCCHNIAYYIAMKNYDYYDIYYGAVVDEETRQDIDQMIEYINQTENEGKQVKILSYYSNLYMNVLGKNNGKMDLPFYGNLGKKGEDGLIKEIDELENTNLLILKEKDTVFQESEKVREHIMSTYEQIGEIGKFLIYKVGY